MIRRANVGSVIPVFMAACHLASAQQPPTVTLTVDLGNGVEYQGDIYDPTKFARNPNATPSAGIGATQCGLLNRETLRSLVGRAWRGPKRAQGTYNRG